MRIATANHCYFGLLQYLSTKIKILHNTIICPVIKPGTETWTMKEILEYLKEKCSDSYADGSVLQMNGDEKGTRKYMS